MNILFASFGELSVGCAIRTVSILRALADAGHRIDVVASRVDLHPHPNIRVLPEGRSLSRRRVRLGVLRAISRNHYDVLHAVDDAVVCFSRWARWNKCRVVYDAGRCFGGPNGVAPTLLWKCFPSFFNRKEKRALSRVDLILTSCAQLSGDLQNLYSDARILQLEDIPAQPLFPHAVTERQSVLDRFEGKLRSLVVCSLPELSKGDLKKIFLALRKVADSWPETGFIIKGAPVRDAEPMARNLEILGCCLFLSDDEMPAFLGALDHADAALFIPDLKSRYMEPEVLTILHSSSPLVTVQHEAYASVLNTGNCISVLFSAESISEGLVQVCREPLFALGISTEGQQLVADHYSLSSFKHRVRMAYHGFE